MGRGDIYGSRVFWVADPEQGARDAFTVVRRRLGLDEAGTS